MTLNAIGASIGIPAGMAGWKMLSTRSVEDFTAFSRNPMLQRDLAYLREKLPTKATAKDLLADYRLQEMVLKAYGLDSQIGMNALMQKVLESDPTDTSSVAGRMTDQRFRQISAALNYGGIVIPEIPAVPSTITVQVDGVRGSATNTSFTSFSGSFGGVSVEDVSLEGLGSRVTMAAVLQAALQKADGGNTDITVTAHGLNLVFSDALGRGTPQVSFTAPETGTARAYLVSSTAGSAAVAGSGGPKVTDSATIEKVVSLYTQAAFEEGLGETSESLRRAVYAKRMLPQISNWYSVIADRNLANVVETLLGLPSSFGQIDVDRQKSILEKRMNIADFSDPTKLGKLLERYVATTSVEEAKALASSSGVLSLIQPVYWGQDNYSGASAAALFSIIGNS